MYTHVHIATYCMLADAYSLSQFLFKCLYTVKVLRH
jgi:hypothetical protein